MPRATKISYDRQSILLSISAAIFLSCAALITGPQASAAIDRPFFRALPIVIVIAATEDETNGGVAPVVVDFNLLTPASSGSAATDLIGRNGFVFNSNSGFDPGHDMSGGASRLTVDNETFGGNFGNPGGGDIDYLEATDSLSAFGLDETTDINTRRARNVSRFLVVSNTAFDIYAEASNLTRTGDFATLNYENIGFRSRLNRSGGSGLGRWGDAAQNPAVGGSGLDATLDDLADLSAGPTKIFDGGRRTARTSGSLLEQAVSFNIRYALSLSADASETNAYDFSMGTGTIGADVTYTMYTP
ncbi:MAG: hypothetical protein ABJN22_09880 [Litorimonas sp.]